MLESMCHTDSFFLTLTYTDEKLPNSIGSGTGPGLATLRPKDLQDWLKRFRRAIEPLKIRYFGVGEYGDVSFRPHYHVVVFGYPGCSRVRTVRALGTNKPDATACCRTCQLVYETWGHGLIEVASLSVKSAAYISQYTVKKMTAKDDPRLKGRFPEFARMSLKPGIGHDSLWDVASQMMRYSLDDTLVDVPSRLRHGTLEYPLGRYLMRKLREKLGKEGSAPQEVLDRIAAEMLPLRLAAKENLSLKQEVLKRDEQKLREFDAKQQIYIKRRVL